jgi:hypothetical protein
MVKAAKTQPPQPEVSAETSLAERIKQARAEADAFIDLKAAELKAGDGKKSPIGVLRQMITRGDSCQCRAALRLLDEKNNG